MENCCMNCTFYDNTCGLCQLDGNLVYEDDNCPSFELDKNQMGADYDR
jgi:hypothetical protein